ncbi:MAG TPA: MarR family transcriptional regulator [Anaeromyxobacteraceae bacterium]|nr:MarR family transcriptional regulator [Anaeromyxobacteraceae bacterium]
MEPESVLEFMQSLWAVDHGFVKLSKRMRTTLGVTGRQRLVVRQVGRHPGISAGALARILHLHPSTLTGVLRRLVDRGLLRRSVDARDARRTRFLLTASGWRVDALRAGTVEWRVREALAACSRRDVETARRVLLRVVASLARS